MEQIIDVIHVDDRDLLEFGVPNEVAVTDIGQFFCFVFQPLPKRYLFGGSIKNDLDRFLLVFGICERFESLPCVPQTLQPLPPQEWISVGKFSAAFFQHVVEDSVPHPEYHPFEVIPQHRRKNTHDTTI